MRRMEDEGGRGNEKTNMRYATWVRWRDVAIGHYCVVAR